MLSQECTRELKTSWLPNITDVGLDRLIDLLEKGSPLLIHGSFTRSVPMGCLATHIAWHHPRTGQRLEQRVHLAVQRPEFVRVRSREVRDQVHALVETERKQTAHALGEREDEFMRLKVEGIRECAEVLVVAARIESDTRIPGVTLSHRPELLKSELPMQARLGEAPSWGPDVAHLHQVDEPDVVLARERDPTGKTTQVRVMSD